MDRFYGGDDFEYCDYAHMCTTGGVEPHGLLYGIEFANEKAEIFGAFDATEDLVYGFLDAPSHSPAGGYEFLDNCMMLGAFAQIVNLNR